MLIHHFLENSADNFPDKVAVIHGGSRYTFLDIEKKANALANWLISKGIEKGDRVALLLRNSVDYVCSYYGLLKAGAVAVPLNTGLDAKEFGSMIENCAPDVLICETLFSQLLEVPLKSASLRLIVWMDQKGSNDLYLGDIYGSCSDCRPELPMIDLDLSSIIYTSGSTGKPKGAMLSHLNIVANTRSIVSYLKLNSNDRCMVALPFYYVYGKSLLNTHFSVSGSVVIDNRFIFPNAVLQTMQQENATGFSGVPSTFSILLNRSSFGEMAFPDLRYLTQAGGHMPEVDKKIFIMYGATEASARLAYRAPDQLENRIHSVGKAIPNIEIKVVKESGLTARPGEKGEIIARGSNIMRGYWENPEETAKVLKNGWYYTGDIGMLDNEGYFYITGRKRDMIKAGNHKINATEIEEILFQHPVIEEAAVIGVPDDVQGEAIKAYVVVKNNHDLSKEAIIEFCSQILPKHKLPGEIVFIDSMPKNETGKVLKQQL